MKYVLLSILFVTSAACSQTQPARNLEKTVVKATTEFGKTKHNTDQLVIKGNRVYTANEFGAIRYNKPSYKIEEPKRGK